MNGIWTNQIRQFLFEPLAPKSKEKAKKITQMKDTREGALRAKINLWAFYYCKRHSASNFKSRIQKHTPIALSMTFQVKVKGMKAKTEKSQNKKRKKKLSKWGKREK